jgi:hypothetical protein
VGRPENGIPSCGGRLSKRKWCSCQSSVRRLALRYSCVNYCEDDQSRDALDAIVAIDVASANMVSRHQGCGQVDT